MFAKGFPRATVQAMASWSLPPLPKFLRLITELESMLPKILSTPPKDVPLCSKTIRGHKAWMVRDAELALKSPTRITASPGCDWFCITRRILLAIEGPPQEPPELISRGPWWFMKSNFRPVVLCSKRIHCTPRLP